MISSIVKYLHSFILVLVMIRLMTTIQDSKAIDPTKKVNEKKPKSYVDVLK
jgi:hypothetical protein